VWRQGTGAGIDAERAGHMRVAEIHSRAAIARNHVEVPCRRMRPDVLDVGRQRDRATFAQRGVGDVDVKESELRPDAGVEDGLGHGGSTSR
jgi:hypothetical protein